MSIVLLLIALALFVAWVIAEVRALRTAARIGLALAMMIATASGVAFASLNDAIMRSYERQLHRANADRMIRLIDAGFEQDVADALEGFYQQMEGGSTTYRSATLLYQWLEKSRESAGVPIEFPRARPTLGNTSGPKLSGPSNR